MTPEEVQVSVDWIEHLHYDDDAHAAEDDLYERILREVSAIDNNPNFTYFDLANIVLCAKIALGTKNKKMYRQF